MVFFLNTGICWHCDDDNITQISDIPKGIYIREGRKKKKRFYDRLNRCIIRGLYQNNPYDKIQLFVSRIRQYVQNQSYEKSNRRSECISKII